MRLKQFKFINNWKYRGWHNAKFLCWSGINIYQQKFLVLIIFGIALIIVV